MSGDITRRFFTLSLPVAVGGCAVGKTTSPPTVQSVPTKPVTVAPLNPPPLPPEGKLDFSPDSSDVATYAAITSEPFPVPAIDLKRINPAFLRRTVSYASADAPGTVIVDPAKRYLYYILGGGRAVRYGVGVGREGFGWSGEAYIRSKQEWPKWFPPPRCANASRSSRNTRPRTAWRAGQAIRSARVPCISGKATRTLITGCTGRSSRGRSARAYPPVASA